MIGVAARRAKMIVTMDDGSVHEFNPNRPRLLLDMEKRWGVQTPERHEHVVWLAHHALKVDEPLDEWVDGVEDIVAMSAEEIAAAEAMDEGKAGAGTDRS